MIPACQTIFPTSPRAPWGVCWYSALLQSAIDCGKRVVGDSQDFFPLTAVASALLARSLTRVGPPVAMMVYLQNTCIVRQAVGYRILEIPVEPCASEQLPGTNFGGTAMTTWWSPGNGLAAKSIGQMRHFEGSVNLKDRVLFIHNTR